jgi:ArsR family transcriptional regulator
MTSKKLYEMQAEICSALSHPVRLHILDLLADKELSSAEILEILDIPKANLSQHLTVLKDAGILVGRKEGQFQILRLALPKIKVACQLVRGILSDRLALEEKNVAEWKKNLEKTNKVVKK